jgi:hypothetical protein
MVLFLVVKRDRRKGTQGREIEEEGHPTTLLLSTTANITQRRKSSRTELVKEKPWVNGPFHTEPVNFTVGRWRAKFFKSEFEKKTDEETPKRRDDQLIVVRQRVLSYGASSTVVGPSLNFFCSLSNDPFRMM